MTESPSQSQTDTNESANSEASESFLSPADRDRLLVAMMTELSEIRAMLSQSESAEESERPNRYL